MTFSALLDQAIQLYIDERYDEAYDLITDAPQDMVSIDSQIMNFRYSIAAKAGRLELAKQLFIEAVEEKGYWYGKDYLMSDDDLAQLREDPDILKLIELCGEREILAKSQTKGTLNAEGMDHAGGTLLALHGNQQNARVIREHFAMVLNHDFRLIMPQSSQADCTDAFVWNDLDQAVAEMRDHAGETDLSLRPLIVSGFSAGARLSLKCALDEILAPDYCILLAPWLPELEEWEKEYDFEKLKAIHFQIYVGDQDEECLTPAQKLHQLLEQKGVKSELTVVADMGHRIPEDFETRLKTLLMKG